MCILTVFETIWKCREYFEIKDGKWCILVIFETAMRKNSKGFDLINVT